jgi:hypothetical protein
MHKIKTSIALFVVVAAISFSALAACKPTPSNLDEAFGVGQLGQPYKDLLPTIKPREFAEFNSDPRCLRMDNTAYDCSFKDADGISYEDDGKGLYSKSIRLRDSPTLVLPFGLMRGDKLDAVIKKTEPYRKRKFTTEREGLYAYYLSGLCYVNARGKKFSLNFHFDHEGLLTSMNVTSEDAPKSDPLQ